MKPANSWGARPFVLCSDTRLFCEKLDRLTEVHGHGAWCCGPILLPPSGPALNLICGPFRYQDAKPDGQFLRGSVSRRSSNELDSPRSISAMAWSNSSSSSCVRKKASLAPRESTVTRVPSGRLEPSTTTRPLTTVPVVTCMDEMVHASVPPVRPTRASQSTLERHSGLELAFVFGSVVRGPARDGSELDIFVQGAQPLCSSQKMALIGDLAEAMGRPVDLIDLRTVGQPLARN